MSSNRRPRIRGSRRSARPQARTPARPHARTPARLKVYTAAPAVARAIREHARTEHPRECCGFLLGHHGSIQFALPMTNIAATPEVRYRIDDRAHLELRRWLRHVRPPLEIVGVYHSHPEGDPVPSSTDIREAYYPEWVYVIAGLRNGAARLRGFRIAPGAALETPIVWRRGGKPASVR